jgi:hypothetical protein
MSEQSRFPLFNYTADQVVKYTPTLDFFTILLTDGTIVHYTPTDPIEFEGWLRENNKENIKETLERRKSIIIDSTLK